jgi:hypothetical protein
MSIYLYVKTHRITGLKYLGKTSQDPQRYQGSGLHWQRHIKLHGNHVDTEILRECQSEDEVRQWGLYYSELWNVVDDPQWANLQPESGQGSGQWLQDILNERGHPFKDREAASKRQRALIEAGTHHLLGGEVQGRASRTRVENDTHNLTKRPDGSSLSSDRVSAGTHNWLQQPDGSYLNNPGKRRVSCLYCKTETNLSSLTQNHADGACLTRAEQRRLDREAKHEATHWTCEHCGKSGWNRGLYTRWHQNGRCLQPPGSA